jgi:hypothetical protein
VVLGAVVDGFPKVKDDGEVVAVVVLGVEKEPKELVVEELWGVVNEKLGEVVDFAVVPNVDDVDPNKGVVVVVLGFVNPENPEKVGVDVVDPKAGVVVPKADGVVEVEPPKLNAGAVVVVAVFPNENAFEVFEVVAAGAKLEKENAEPGVEEG